MKKTILAIAFALASLPAFAQGSLYTGIVIGNNGRPAPGATIRVCQTAGSPCTIGTVTLFTDAALTLPLADPFAADSLGNFYFYAVTQKACIQISGTGITTYNIGSSSTCDVQIGTGVSSPVSIAQGGTNATTAAAAFNNLSPMSTLGDFEYESGASTASRLPGNTSATRKFMSQTGNGSVSAAPAWNQPSVADLTDGSSGSGAVCLVTNCVMVTPTLGAASATSVNYADQTGPQVAGLQEFYIVAADFTLAANTSLQTITGLTWTMPANKALKVNFACKLSYSQATAAVPIAFGIQDVTVAPTNIYARGTIYTSASVFATANVPTLTTTTATSVVSATPSAITTVWNADLDGTIEQPSNASTSAIAIMASTTNSADLVTVKRGSYCRIF